MLTTRYQIGKKAYKKLDEKFTNYLANFVKTKVGGNEDIVMITIIKGTNAELKSLEEKLNLSYKKYVGRCPVEDGCYPTFKCDETSIVGYLHLSPTYEQDGRLLEDVIKSTIKLSRGYGLDESKIAITIL